MCDCSQNCKDTLLQTMPRYGAAIGFGAYLTGSAKLLVA